MINLITYIFWGHLLYYKLSKTLFPKISQIVTAQPRTKFGDLGKKFKEKYNRSSKILEFQSKVLTVIFIILLIN